jgi:4'-phosphopantetheinyl transferase
MVHWLLESNDNLQEPPEAFLSAAELEHFRRFRFEKRRAEWLLGRWTAKRLVQAVLLRATHEIAARRALEIYNDAQGAPHLRVWSDRASARAALADMELTISHSQGRALCACRAGVPGGGTVGLGADLEWVERRESYFARDYFTPAEQARVQAAGPDHDLLVTTIWSAKEAVLKALHKGLSMDTRAVEICIAPFDPVPAQWTPFEITTTPHVTEGWRGWWRAQENFVLTLVSGADETPEPGPLTPETVMVESGALHEGHGVLHQRIAHATRHHARHTGGH